MSILYHVEYIFHILGIVHHSVSAYDDTLDKLWRHVWHLVSPSASRLRILVVFALHSSLDIEYRHYLITAANQWELWWLVSKLIEVTQKSIEVVCVERNSVASSSCSYLMIFPNLSFDWNNLLLKQYEKREISSK